MDINLRTTSFKDHTESGTRTTCSLMQPHPRAYPTQSARVWLCQTACVCNDAFFKDASRAA